MPSEHLSGYSDTARALATQIDDDVDHNASRQPPSGRRSTSPLWTRRSLSQPGARRSNPFNDDQAFIPRWRQKAESLQRRAMNAYFQLSLLQRISLSALGILFFILTIVGIIYNERIFAALAPAAKKWRSLKGGWLILWFVTFFVSFPPLIGYSSCVTIAGFVFGMKGWFIIASATVIGSTCSFLVSRTALRGFVSRLTEKNKRFNALSLVLKHDGLKLLVMIRICPLPYSLSNGAISTIPSVTWVNFAIATAIASPKLLLHVFVGSRLGDLAENGDKMDGKTKLVSYLSILIGMSAGVATGYFVYVRTKARAAQLEAEEAAGAVDGRRTPSRTGREYADDDDERDAVDVLRRGDDVSLHTTYDEDLESGQSGYRDEFTDDEDASERDVFDDGDGDEVEDGQKR